MSSDGELFKMLKSNTATPSYNRKYCCKTNRKLSKQNKMQGNEVRVNHIPSLPRF